MPDDDQHDEEGEETGAQPEAEVRIPETRGAGHRSVIYETLIFARAAISSLTTASGSGA